ncbi:hypothetical protein GCM10009109_09430 [Marinobacterium sediminicola]
MSLVCAVDKCLQQVCIGVIECAGNAGDAGNALKHPVMKQLKSAGKRINIAEKRYSVELEHKVLNLSFLCDAIWRRTVHYTLKTAGVFKAKMSDSFWRKKEDIQILLNKEVIEFLARQIKPRQVVPRLALISDVSES